MDPNPELLLSVVKSSYVNVTKAKVCPACGATNRIRYEFDIMMVEAACSSCGAMVKWKRKDPRSGGQIKTAFEDDTPELVPLNEYERGMRGDSDESSALCVLEASLIDWPSLEFYSRVWTLARLPSTRTFMVICSAVGFIGRIHLFVAISASISLIITPITDRW